jgi:hypothetical protein
MVEDKPVTHSDVVQGRCDQLVTAADAAGAHEWSQVTL